MSFHENLEEVKMLFEEESFVDTFNLNMDKLSNDYQQLFRENRYGYVEKKFGDEEHIDQVRKIYEQAEDMQKTIDAIHDKYYQRMIDASKPKKAYDFSKFSADEQTRLANIMPFVQEDTASATVPQLKSWIKDAKENDPVMYEALRRSTKDHNELSKYWGQVELDSFPTVDKAELQKNKDKVVSLTGKQFAIMEFVKFLEPGLGPKMYFPY